MSALKIFNCEQYLKQSYVNCAIIKQLKTVVFPNGFDGRMLKKEYIWLCTGDEESFNMRFTPISFYWSIDSILRILLLIISVICALLILVYLD